MPGEAIAGFDQEILLVGALDERKIRIRISIITNSQYLQEIINLPQGSQDKVITEILGPIGLQLPQTSPPWNTI